MRRRTRELSALRHREFAVVEHDEFSMRAPKHEFSDNDRSTLKTSEFVKLSTDDSEHQTTSPYDDVRGSYERYTVTTCTTRVTLSNQLLDASSVMRALMHSGPSSCPRGHSQMHGHQPAFLFLASARPTRTTR